MPSPILVSLKVASLLSKAGRSVYSSMSVSSKSGSDQRRRHVEIDGANSEYACGTDALCHTSCHPDHRQCHTGGHGDWYHCHKGHLPQDHTIPDRALKMSGRCRGKCTQESGTCMNERGEERKTRLEFDLYEILLELQLKLWYNENTLWRKMGEPQILVG